MKSHTHTHSLSLSFSHTHTHTELWHYTACRKGHFFPNSLSRNEKTRCSLVGLDLGPCSTCKSNYPLLCTCQLPRCLSGEESACQCRKQEMRDWSPGLGRSPGGGNGNPLSYFCLENFMDRGAWRAIVHGVAKSRTWQSTHTVYVTNDSKSSGRIVWELQINWSR